SGADGQAFGPPIFPIPAFGLAYDPEEEAFYSLESYPARLLRIRLADGRITTVGGIGTLQINGLAFDSRTGRTYGADRNDSYLYDLDPTNGDATIVGWIGNLLSDIAYDSKTDTFFCAGEGGGLSSYDLKTGQRTWLPGPFSAGVRALAYDPNSDTLYGA